MDLELALERIIAIGRPDNIIVAELEISKCGDLRLIRESPLTYGALCFVSSIYYEEIARIAGFGKLAEMDS